MVTVIEDAERVLTPRGNFRDEVEVFGEAIVAHRWKIRRKRRK
jgi:hypothetical protein